MSGIFGTSKGEDDSDWLSVSDLMAGLMVIFLFIAIVFIRDVFRENAKIEEIAVAWQENEAGIYNALIEEFENDLPKWNAEIEQDTLLVRFNAPEVLFEEGQSEIRNEFQLILSDFFPRYIDVLTDYRDAIDEIRIEGHTSSEWNDASPAQAYKNNMELSQARTREVLGFALSLPTVAAERNWVQSLLTANGLSSSRLILDDLGIEDADRSRRVEFRVRTKARTEIVRILEEVR